MPFKVKTALLHCSSVVYPRHNSQDPVNVDSKLQNSPLEQGLVLLHFVGGSTSSSILSESLTASVAKDVGGSVHLFVGELVGLRVGGGVSTKDVVGAKVVGEKVVGLRVGGDVPTKEGVVGSGVGSKVGGCVPTRIRLRAFPNCIAICGANHGSMHTLTHSLLPSELRKGSLKHCSRVVNPEHVSQKPVDPKSKLQNSPLEQGVVVPHSPSNTVGGSATAAATADTTITPRSTFVLVVENNIMLACLVLSCFPLFFFY